MLASDEAILRGAASNSARTPSGSRASTSPATMEMRLVGANPNAVVEGKDQLAARINYFIGRDRSRWHTNVPAVGEVLVHDAWPGIDVEYGRDPEQSSGALECIFTARPGVDPSIIRLAFEGIDHIRTLPGGALSLWWGAREIRFTRLHVFEESDGQYREVPAHLVLEASTRGSGEPSEFRVHFQVSRRDSGSRLIIDPTLIYSSYIGGSGESSAGSYLYGTGDSANAIALDQAGNEYLTGSTTSPDFPGPSSKFLSQCPSGQPCNPAIVT